MFDQSTRHVLEAFAPTTMDQGRFVRQVATTVRGLTGDKRAMADGPDSFSGRLRTIKAAEISGPVSAYSAQIYLLTSQARISLAVEDMVKDERTGFVYEVLGDQTAGEIVTGFYLGRAK